MGRNSDEQENVSPCGTVSGDARLQLVPPTPEGMAPLQAAAASVAAKRGVPLHRGQSALSTVQGELIQKLPCLLPDARACFTSSMSKVLDVSVCVR